MIALIIGLVLMLFAVYSVLPFDWSLQWWQPVVAFLKGGVPILALFIGVIAFFIGVADIKDKIESKREEEEEAEADTAEADTAEQSSEDSGSGE